MAYASSLDQAGPFARTVRDAAILLASMAGHDPKDTTSVDLPVPDYEAAVGKSVKGMKIGIPKEYRVDGMAAEIESALGAGRPMARRRPAPRWSRCRCRTPNTRCRPITSWRRRRRPRTSRATTAFATGCACRGRDITDMYEKTRAEGFGKEVRRRVMIGTYVLSAGYYDAYYLRAQKVRTLIKRDFEDCFARGVDAILTPATPSAAFGIGEKGGADPVEMYLNDIFTVTVNMAGLPGISPFRAALSAEGLPLGLQLIGRPFDEETLFSLGQVIEDAAGRFSPQPWW